MILESTFHTTCAVCTKPITPGDLVQWRSGFPEVRHEKCSAEYTERRRGKEPSPVNTIVFRVMAWAAKDDGMPSTRAVQVGTIVSVDEPDAEKNTEKFLKKLLNTGRYNSSDWVEKKT